MTPTQKWLYGYEPLPPLWMRAVVWLAIVVMLVYCVALIAAPFVLIDW